jgi:hypothetical protein
MLEVIAFLALAGEESRFFERREVDFWNSRRRARSRRRAVVGLRGAAAGEAAPGAPTAQNARAYLPGRRSG